MAKQKMIERRQRRALRQQFFRELRRPNPHVVRALALLEPADQPDPRRIVVGVRPRDVNASYVYATDRIVVNRDGDAYQHAVAGDCRRLAASIAHEEMHRRGFGEAEAYLKTAKVLHDLKCDPSLVDHTVECARDWAVIEGDR